MNTYMSRPLSLVDALVMNYRNNAATVSKEQVGNIVFERWDDCLRSLHNVCVRPRYYPKQTFNDTIKKLIRDITAMIGKINGTELCQDASIMQRIHGYVINGVSPLVQPYGADSYAIFKINLEKYLGVMITELRGSSRQNQDNIIRIVPPETNPETVPLTNPVTVIETFSFENILFRDSLKEHMQHGFETRKALISIVNTEGEIVPSIIGVSYCKKCCRYFISEAQYQYLKKEGVILCRIVSDTQKNIAFFGNFKTESVLKSCGYTVSQNEGLSNAQRQAILKCVLQYKLYQKNELITFLRWLIDQNHHAEKRNMANALSKWQADLEYVRTL